MNSEFWKFVIIFRSIIEGANCKCTKCIKVLPYSNNCIIEKFKNFYKLITADLQIKFAIDNLMKFFGVNNIIEMNEAWTLFLNQISDINHLLHYSFHNIFQRLSEYLIKEIQQIENKKVIKEKCIYNKKITRPDMHLSSDRPLKSDMQFPPGIHLPPGVQFIPDFRGPLDFRPPPGLPLPINFKPPPGLPTPSGLYSLHK
jgi:hypothetical protein